MRRWKMSFFGCFLMFTACAAQAQREFEITPFAGTRFGGYIDLSQQGNPNVDSLKIKSSVNYGIMGITRSVQSSFGAKMIWNKIGVSKHRCSLSSHSVDLPCTTITKRPPHPFPAAAKHWVTLQLPQFQIPAITAHQLLPVSCSGTTSRHPGGSTL
jgi:hypothetical protein